MIGSKRYLVLLAQQIGGAGLAKQFPDHFGNVQQALSQISDQIPDTASIDIPGATDTASSGIVSQSSGTAVPATSGAQPTATAADGQLWGRGGSGGTVGSAPTAGAAQTVGTAPSAGAAMGASSSDSSRDMLIWIAGTVKKVRSDLDSVVSAVEGGHAPNVGAPSPSGASAPSSLPTGGTSAASQATPTLSNVSGGSGSNASPQASGPSTPASGSATQPSGSGPASQSGGSPTGQGATK